MIKLSHVSKRFKQATVLRDVTFSLRPGEFVGMVGPSGCGKSVLLKILGKVIAPTSGTIDYEAGEGVSKELSVGFLFQEGALFDSMSVLENVAFALGEKHGTQERELAYERSYNILTQVGLQKAHAKLPGQLSGGMRRRVALARALVHKPDLVLLDDPTGGLDPVAASVIIDLIKSLHAEYCPTVIMVSHDIRRLLPNVQRVVALFNGVIVCDMTPGELSASAPENVLHFLATRFDFSTFNRSVNYSKGQKE